MTETTTQVERVARAMARHNHPGGSERDIDEMWEGWTGEATAAINAMSEPTMAMLNAAVDATEAGAGMSWVNRSPQKLFQVGYQAMLANALAPQPHTAPIPHEQGRDEVERLREALRPFANRADKIDGKWLDHETHWSPAYGSTEITIGDLRRARAALSPPLS